MEDSGLDSAMDSDSDLMMMDSGKDSGRILWLASGSDLLWRIFYARFWGGFCYGF